MVDEGYRLSDNSKFTHSLDSFVWNYETMSGSSDVLKIEVNYSNRCHILNPVLSKSSNVLEKVVEVNHLAFAELIGSKVNALIVRTTPRDVYDVYNLIKNGSIVAEDLIRKIAVFYAVLGSERPVEFDRLIDTACLKMSKLNFNKARETLLPVLHKGEKIVIEDIVKTVSDYLRNGFELNALELKYIEYYNKGEYHPELLFQNMNINDISNHPMVLWKLNNK